jgi:hypothetical protein
MLRPFPLQVGAIRVSACDVREAEIEQANKISLGLNRNSDILPSMDESVFIAQLSKRAQLLDHAFQAAVREVVQRHAAARSEFVPITAGRLLQHSGAPVKSTRRDSQHPQGGDLPDSGSKTFSRVDAGSPDKLELDASGGLLVQVGAPTSRESKQDACEVNRCASDSCRGASQSAVNQRASTAMRGGEYGAQRLLCQFKDGASEVLVDAAPPKAVERMREKMTKYVPPHPASRWPLSANILDPIRASVVCHGASQVLQVLGWFAELQEETGLRICRIKNRFCSMYGDSADGYRDVKLYLAFTAACGLRIIGEVQIHDAELYDLKLKVCPFPSSHPRTAPTQKR